MVVEWNVAKAESVWKRGRHRFSQHLDLHSSKLYAETSSGCGDVYLGIVPSLKALNSRVRSSWVLSIGKPIGWGTWHSFLIHAQPELQLFSARGQPLLERCSRICQSPREQCGALRPLCYNSKNVEALLCPDSSWIGAFLKESQRGNQANRCSWIWRHQSMSRWRRFKVEQSLWPSLAYTSVRNTTFLLGDAICNWANLAIWQATKFKRSLIHMI